jgi:16S rRNA (adenine1518-N6/adenine1519-N6)-dimethyltransferase
MNLEKRMEELMGRHGIEPDSLLDQSFMVDEGMIKSVVTASGVKAGETVVEVGAGIGFVSRELARTGARVVSIEIDKRLGTILKDELRGAGVKIVCGNALKEIRKIRFDRVVSNTPYSVCEPLVQELAHLNFKQVCLSVPKRFAYRLLERKGLGLVAQAFFDIEILFDIPKSAFKPAPKVSTVFIKICHRGKGYYKKHMEDFILRELVLQRTKMLRNALMEAVINWNGLIGKNMTKNQARETIKSLNLNNELLGKRIKHIDVKQLGELYRVVSRLLDH